jgi:hypothetical protein
MNTGDGSAGKLLGPPVVACLPAYTTGGFSIPADGTERMEPPVMPKPLTADPHHHLVAVELTKILIEERRRRDPAYELSDQELFKLYHKVLGEYRKPTPGSVQTAD